MRDVTRWTVAAVLLSVACAAAATWPAFSSPRDTILCNFVHPDCLSNHWLLIWVADQISSGGSILHNDRYYWPVGDAPWLAGNGSEGFAYLPWHLLLGWPLASTVHLVGMLVLNGVAGWALARSAGASPAASLAAASTGALMLYCIHELGAGRFTQVSACWLVFFCAAWLRFLDEPAAHRAVGAALLLAVASFFYWYYGFFGVLAGACLLAARLPGWIRARDAAAAKGLAVFVGAFLALIAPLLWVFLKHWSAIPGTGEDVFPHPETVNDSTWPKGPFLVQGGRHAGLALPFTTCALAVVGLVRRDKRWLSVGLGLVVVLFVGLMAGGLVQHGPYELIYGLAGPLKRFWWPYRHVVALNFALVALAARGADLLVARRPWLGVLLALSIPLQLQLQGAPWHAQFSKAEMPEPFYVRLKDAPGEVVIEPPIAPQLASAQSHLIYQTLHRKALLSGHALWVDRVRPDAWDEFVAKNSFLTEMQRLERGELTDGVFRFRGEDLRALLDAGVGPFVVNREYFPVALKELVDAYGEVFIGLFGAPADQGKRLKSWDGTRWNGATEARFEPYTWPDALRPGGPTLAITGVRAPSNVFSVPAPEEKKKP
jgi:hypothetical protein